MSSWSFRRGDTQPLGAAPDLRATERSAAARDVSVRPCLAVDAGRNARALDASSLLEVKGGWGATTLVAEEPLAHEMDPLAHEGVDARRFLDGTQPLDVRAPRLPVVEQPPPPQQPRVGGTSPLHARPLAASPRCDEKKVPAALVTAFSASPAQVSIEPKGVAGRQALAHEPSAQRAARAREPSLARDIASRQPRPAADEAVACEKPCVPEPVALREPAAANPPGPLREPPAARESLAAPEYFAAPEPPPPAPHARAPHAPVARERPAPQFTPIDLPPLPDKEPKRLFRQAALDAHYGVGADLEDMVRPRPAAWGALVILGSLVVALFAGAAIAQVEVTVKAPGALRAPNGLRSVESVLAGAVSEVLAQAGELVEAGQVLVRLEDAKLRSSLVLQERQLELARRDMEDASRVDRAALDAAFEASRRQRDALRTRSGINQTILQKRTTRRDNVNELVAHGAASQDDALAVDESVHAATEQLAVLQTQLTEVDLAHADRVRDWQARELERRAAVSRQSANVDEARSLLELTTIRSPSAGRVESLLAKVGEVVSAGEILAQIVPADAPRAIVGFLPSREAAFVSVGSEATVEVEALPVNEFGLARARVLRISADIAQPEELTAAFGEGLPGAHVRVELELESDVVQAKMAPHLRSGERVLVRLHSRERRVLSLLFEFVRKWLDP
ncbi:MAG TPA: HlyD family efflux transporter periplasmic adaptor subunit [Polyangiaceae bacterium]|nr:HlyD family efflux transporter periplasmic adaptor subunit [Polyangiaceae bacterium]